MVDPLHTKVTTWIRGLSQNERLKYTKVVTINIPEIRTRYPDGTRGVDILTVFRVFTSILILSVAKELKALERLQLHIVADGVSSFTGTVTIREIVQPLSETCRIFPSERAGVDIHVAVEFGTNGLWLEEALDIVRSLFGISSLTVGIHIEPGPVMEGALRSLVEHCPKMQVSSGGCLVHLRRPFNSKYNAPRGFHYLGMEEERDNRWYLQRDTEEGKGSKRTFRWDFIILPIGKRLYKSIFTFKEAPDGRFLPP